MKFTFGSADHIEGDESTEINSEDEQNEQDIDVEINQDDDVETIDRNEAPGRRKIPLLKLVGDDVCSVCGSRGHKAGFAGARYVDCINKPW
jgi:hypothetical protein